MSRIDEERAKTKEFAEKNGISETEIERVFQEVLKNMPAHLSDAQKEIRALRKTRGTLRKSAQNGKRVEGFLFMRFPDANYNKYAWDRVQRTIEEEGIDYARSQVMVNEKDEPIHWQGFSKGEKIDHKQVYGSAVGLFAGENGLEARDLSIGSFSMDKVVPMCQECTFIVANNVKDKAGRVITDKPQYYFNNAMGVEDKIYTQAEADVYLEYLEEHFGDVLFSTYEEAVDFLASNDYSQTAFAGVPVVVSDIGVGDDPSSNVFLSFEENDSQETIEGWISPMMLKGLNIDEYGVGIVFFNVRQDKDGNLHNHIGGFIPIEEE